MAVKTIKILGTNVSFDDSIDIDEIKRTATNLIKNRFNRPVTVAPGKHHPQIDFSAHLEKKLLKSNEPYISIEVEGHTCRIYAIDGMTLDQIGTQQIEIAKAVWLEQFYIGMDEHGEIYID